MSAYNTEQKKMLEEFMYKNRDNSFTIDEINEKISSEVGASAPARSTVYRLIKALVEEGRVRKFVNSDSRRASYQLVCGNHCEAHLHLKCMGCGVLIHMDESLSDELVRAINSKNNFSLDEEETVLYGRCSACGKI